MNILILFSSSAVKLLRFLFGRQIFAGDCLASVNHYAVDGLNHHRIIRMIHGAVGTRVKLGFHRQPAGPGMSPESYFVTLDRALPPAPFQPGSVFGPSRKGAALPNGRSLFFA